MSAMIAAVVVGSAIKAYSANRAKNKQIDAANQAMNEQERSYFDMEKLLQPFISQGKIGMEGREKTLGQLENWGDTGLQRVMANPLTKGVLGSAEDSILANASATGGLRGGNVQDALARTRMSILAGLENQQYTRTAGIFDAYTGIANSGQTASTNLASLRGGNGNAMANLQIQKGAYDAGGTLAVGSAIAQGFSGMAGAYSGGGGGGAKPLGSQWNDYSQYGGEGMQDYDYIDNDAVQGLSNGGRGF